MQILRKFPDVLVTVDRNRVNGVKSILEDKPDTEVIIILDDGFPAQKNHPRIFNSTFRL